MKPLKPLFGKAIFKSSVPLITGGTFYLAEGMISCLQVFSQNHSSMDPHSNPEGISHNLENAFRQMRTKSLSAYDNLFHFLVAILIINFIWEILISNGRTKGKMSSKDLEGDQNSTNSLVKKPVLKTLIIWIFSYSLAYFVIQTILGFLVFSTTNIDSIPTLLKTSDEPISLSQTELFTSTLPRILEEEKGLSQQNQMTPNLVSEKISFSIARVLGSLDLPLSSIVLSKDGKLAFVIIQTFGTLKIINVSDPQYPVVKASLDLVRPIEFYGQKALFLASDEKTLFASNFKNLEIIDVSDPLSPKLLGTYNEKDLPDSKGSSNLKGQFITTMAMSSDKKNLFVGGLGLQIFDISNGRNPQILFKTLNDLSAEFPIPGSVALSANGQNLFAANGVTLDIYDVSNPSSPSLKISWKQEDFLASSIFLADDKKTAYVTGNAPDGVQLVLKQVDISNPEAPVVLQKFFLFQEKECFAFVIGASPHKTQLYFAFYSSGHLYNQGFALGVFDATKSIFLDADQSLLNYAYSVVISPDGKRAFAAAFSQFVVFEFFTNYPNSQVLSLTRNVIGSFKIENYWSDIIPSADNKILYVSYLSLTNFKECLEIWNVTDRYSPILIGSLQIPGIMTRMIITPDYQRVFFFSMYRIIAINITNITNPTFFPSYQLSERGSALKMETSRDGNTLFVLMSTTESSEKKTFLMIIDYSDVNAIKEVSRIESEQINYESKFAISQDEKTLFVVQSTSEIYDISDLSKPTLVESFSILRNEPTTSTYSVILSPDSKTLFTELLDTNHVKKLRIFNVSNPGSITMLSEIYLPMFKSWSRFLPLHITPDYKTGYVFQEDKVLALNLTDLSAPSICGAIPVLNGLYPSSEEEKVTNFMVAPDGKTAFVTNQYRDLTIIDLELKYTLFINQESFLLGKKYSDGIMLFQRTDQDSFTPLGRDTFKFLTLSMLDFKIALNRAVSEMKFSGLPSWITFDWSNHALTIDTKRQTEIGNYTLYSTGSKQIPATDILDLNFVNNNLTVFRDLIVMLQSLNYIDNDLFLTSKFGDWQTFILGGQFGDFTNQIYALLKSCHVETATRFEVKASASLSLDSEEKFVIQTPSESNIRVEILLHPGGQKEEETEGQFLLKPYASLIPGITEKKSRLKIEGPLDEVNQALREIVINYEHETWCNGEIHFMDNMNPPVNQFIANISKYFLRNGLPKVNPDVVLSVQEQAEISPIYTGQYFTINLNKSTFIDDHIEDLSYHLLMAKEPHELPNWLIFEDLVIKGTPPEEVFGRDIELVLTVKNEFKTLEVPLKLHINISSVFLLKLLMRYSPYILTAIGLFISANKFYNIIAQRRYKHRKEFFIKVGEEVTPEAIFPVSFIREEQRESKLILKEISKFVAKERGVSDKTEVLNYFIDPTSEKLDKQKVVRVIRKVFKEMSNRDLLYGSGQSSKINIINRLIINELVKWQINSNQEKETRIVFERIKNRWADIVDWDSNVSGFVINSEKFEKIMDFSSHERRRSTIITQDNSQEESLIGNNKNINMNLLKDAILAFAFEDHNIGENSILVEVVIKQRVRSNLLWRVLKFDLKEIHLNEKSKLDYGINYKIQGDTLYFYGVPHESFGGKTIVIQITNRRRRILKEIWMYGSSSKQIDSSFEASGGNDEVDIPL